MLNRSEAASSEPGTMPSWAQAMEAVAVDRYLLGPELGRGGMGRVHAAWDPVLKRVVAIKLLLGSDPELNLRLLREARTQAKLDHPGICRIHDLGHAEGRPYIAMQLVQGRSLVDLQPELTYRAMAEILADTAEAVQAAHQAGLIHRDLKPANILVEARGGSLHPFVVDFGLARDLTALDQTLSWAVLGTPAFMSPEQARGEALGPATDLYSLGATLYALITGRPPYEGSTLAGLVTNQVDHGVRAVRRLAPAVPRDLETITLKCLEREPARRYPSAQALAQDLRRFLAGEPIAARPVGPVGTLWRWARRRPALAGTAAAGIVVSLLLLGWNGHIRATSRLRERAAQRFGLEIRDAEHLLRIERMLPTHDIRPAEARLRARLEAIRAEMAALGHSAEGPGHYALGRGHLALREFEAAIHELDAAWAAGFQPPEVAYGMGLARLSWFHERQQLAMVLGRAEGEVESLRATLVAPALAWMARAQGAQVDHPDYGRALAAMATDRFAEADQLFQQAQAQAPWLYEAALGRCLNEMYWHLAPHPPLRPVTDRGPVDAQVEALFEQVERIAPSDDMAWVTQANHHLGRSIQQASHASRDPAPLTRAVSLFEKALQVRPDSRVLQGRLAGATLQAGFLMLSTGRDPGALARDTATALTQSCQAHSAPQDSEWQAQLGTICHLWWVAAEADQRFGRDPWASLQAGRRAREGRPLDLHTAFPLLIEAKCQGDRRQDPQPTFQAALDLLRGIQPRRDYQANPFFFSTLGEVCFERAGWEWTTRRRGGDSLKEALAALDHARALDPRFAFTFYHLPRAHALAVRMALAKGTDPTASVAKALEAARHGVSINPANAALQLAAADAHLADGQARLARGEDPGPAWAACRKALEAGARTNPRDYHLLLLRAELEAVQAASGREGETHREAAAAACRAGLRLKGDEPRFRLLLRALEGPPGARPPDLTLG
jgi:tetratricopeptide (TPR) repeat protein